MQKRGGIEANSKNYMGIKNANTSFKAVNNISDYNCQYSTSTALSPSNKDSEKRLPMINSSKQVSSIYATISETFNNKPTPKSSARGNQSNTRTQNNPLVVKNNGNFLKKLEISQNPINMKAAGKGSGSGATSLTRNKNQPNELQWSENS